MPRHVLLAPLMGYRKEADWERLQKTIMETDASRVRLLTLPPDLDKTPEVREFIREKLRDMAKRWPRFEWDEGHVNLFSFDACLESLSVLFSEERGNDISVSLGTSGSPGAVPATIACLLWGGRGIYIGDEDYGQPPVTIPNWVRVEGPLGPDELRVLGLVLESRDGLDKKTIVEKLKEAGRIRADQDKHAYRRLASDFLPRLVAHGFVTVGPRDGWDGRHKFVTATEEGHRAYRVLAPLLGRPRGAIFVRGALSKHAHDKIVARE